MSVVIPAYNAARFLPATLESVYRQSVTPFEVIVVDDGSTDATPEVMRKFQDRVIYLRKENGGPSSARNLGTLRARGEWIAFLDADDQWNPDRLERQLDMAKRTGSDLIFSDAALVMTNGGEKSKAFPSWLETVGGRPKIEAALVNSVMLNPFQFFLEVGCLVLVSTVLVRREAVLKAGLFDEQMGGCEDWDLLFRLSAHCRMAFIPESLVTRHVYGGNLSLNDPVMTKGALMMWDKAARYDAVVKTPKWRKRVKMQRAAHHMVVGVLCAEVGDKAGARASFLKCLELSFHPRAAVHLALLPLPTSLGNAIRRAVRPLRRKWRALTHHRITRD